MPKSASRASPGPLTTHPITATLIGALMDAKRSSTIPAMSNKLTWHRPHVGQEIIVAPKFRNPKLLKILRPTSISCIGSPVRDTRKVSPIPSNNKAPMPIADLMVPCFIVPASVTPKCKG